MLRAREKMIFPALSTLPVAPPLEIASFEMVKENEARSEHPVVSNHWICQLPSKAPLDLSGALMVGLFTGADRTAVWRFFSSSKRARAIGAYALSPNCLMKASSRA